MEGNVSLDQLDYSQRELSLGLSFHRRIQLKLCSLTPKPLMLFYHFFSVAFYSIYILLTQGPPPPPGMKGHKPGMAEMPGLVLLSGRVVCLPC